MNTIKFAEKYFAQLADGMVPCLATLFVLENNSCGATLVGAQMQFCFARFDSETNTSQGNLFGLVNTAEDCCQACYYV